MQLRKHIAAVGVATLALAGPVSLAGPAFAGWDDDPGHGDYRVTGDYKVKVHEDEGHGHHKRCTDVKVKIVFEADDDWGHDDRAKSGYDDDDKKAKELVWAVKVDDRWKFRVSQDWGDRDVFKTRFDGCTGKHEVEIYKNYREVEDFNVWTGRERHHHHKAA
jgi:hypothetical protein